jgi:hypothetical protein
MGLLTLEANYAFCSASCSSSNSNPPRGHNWARVAINGTRDQHTHSRDRLDLMEWTASGARGERVALPGYMFGLN